MDPSEFQGCLFVTEELYLFFFNGFHVLTTAAIPRDFGLIDKVHEGVPEALKVVSAALVFPIQRCNGACIGSTYKAIVFLWIVHAILV